MSEKIFIIGVVFIFFLMFSLIKWLIDEEIRKEKSIEELNEQERINGTWGRYTRE